MSHPVSRSTGSTSDIGSPRADPESPRRSFGQGEQLGDCRRDLVDGVHRGADVAERPVARTGVIMALAMRSASWSMTRGGADGRRGSRPAAAGLGSAAGRRADLLGDRQAGGAGPR